MLAGKGAIKGGVKLCRFLGEPVFVPTAVGVKHPKLGEIMSVLLEPGGSSAFKTRLENIAVPRFD